MASMTPRQNLAAFAFTLLFAAMAGFHQFYAKLDPIVIALILLASLPWALPLLAPLVSSLKVGGLELVFREMKEQIAETKQVAEAAVSALVTGVGRAPGSAPAMAAGGRASALDELVAHDAARMPRMGPASEEHEPEDGEASDPNRGSFGGKAETGGRKLSAEVRAMPGSTDVFLVHLWVAATDGGRPLRDGTAVTFHLHPSFAQNAVTVAAKAGVAALDRMAWGAFTVGVEVEGVRLELNLATDLANAPDLFRRR